MVKDSTLHSTEEVQGSGMDAYHEMEIVTGPDPEPDTDPVSEWVPVGRRLLSGLLGLNVVMLGAALVVADAFNGDGLLHQDPEVFLLLLMVLSMAWMLWYLFWTRKQPNWSPHTDHHAGGIAVTVSTANLGPVVLMIFSAFSLLAHLFKMGYFTMMSDCQPLAKVLTPFTEAPFMGLQTYLLWAHSKDCIHKHKILTRSGLMLTLSADVLLWLNAVTEDTIHMEVELEKQSQNKAMPINVSLSEDDTEGLGDDPSDSPRCQCSTYLLCLVFRKGFEVIYPFNMEFYLMAGCMLYVMWKNVGRHTDGDSHTEHNRCITLSVIRQEGILLGPLAGLMVLLVGVVTFILYQVWVGGSHRQDAFLIFYGYHLAMVPVMVLCLLAGMTAYRVESRLHEAGLNPTRNLDVLLLVAAALGQLSLSYFSLVAAMAIGSGNLLESLDLSYSLLSLLELVLQNIFIIEGLHRHPSLSHARRKGRLGNSIFKKKKNVTEMQVVDGPGGDSLLKNEATALPEGGKTKVTDTWTKRVIQEACAFLILANIMLWVIPAFGAHPHFENGLGKLFYGFQAWFVLVNLGQPLVVFYRMHSVGALMELLISA